MRRHGYALRLLRFRTAHIAAAAKPLMQWTVMIAVCCCAVAEMSCEEPRIVVENTPHGQRALVMAAPTPKDSLQLNPGEYALLRRIGHAETGAIEFAAIQLSEPRPDGSVEYRCSFRDDGEPSLESARATVGVVAEKLSKSATPGVYSTKQSSLDITCGTFKVMWSVGNWIYFYPTNDTGSPVASTFDIALSKSSALDRIDLFDKDLRWRRFVPGS